MPEDTRVVLRIHPEHTAQMMESAQMQSQDLSQIFVANFLSSQTSKLSFVLANRDENIRPPFDDLDDSRALVLALSTRGNDTYLYNPSDHSFRGISWRLFLPATNTRKLRSQIEDFCARSAASCPDVQRISSARNYITVDLHHDLSRDPDNPALDCDNEDRSFWGSPTTAIDSFLHPRGALSLYVPNEDLAFWAPIIATLELLPLLELITPQHRNRLHHALYAETGGPGGHSTH